MSTDSEKRILEWHESVLVSKGSNYQFTLDDFRKMVVEEELKDILSSVKEHDYKI